MSNNSLVTRQLNGKNLESSNGVSFEGVLRDVSTFDLLQFETFGLNSLVVVTESRDDSPISTLLRVCNNIFSF